LSANNQSQQQKLLQKQASNSTQARKGSGLAQNSSTANTSTITPVAGLGL